MAIKYDFNVVLSTEEQEYYDRQILNEAEYKTLYDLFVLPIEDETVLLTYEQYFEIIKNEFTENLENIHAKMPYKIFLQSPYWKIVSNYIKKSKKYKCQLCTSNSILNSHHNNYKNKGSEYRNLNDLVVLCNKCHQKFHNK